MYLSIYLSIYPDSVVTYVHTTQAVNVEILKLYPLVVRTLLSGITVRYPLKPTVVPRISCVRTTSFTSAPRMRWS